MDKIKSVTSLLGVASGKANSLDGGGASATRAPEYRGVGGPVIT